MGSWGWERWPRNLTDLLAGGGDGQAVGEEPCHLVLFDHLHRHYGNDHLTGEEAGFSQDSLIPRHFQPPHSLFVMIIPSHQSFFKTQVKRHSSRRLHYNVYLPPVTALLNLIPLVCSTGLQRFIWFSINRTLNFKSDFRRNVAV